MKQILNIALVFCLLGFSLKAKAQLENSGHLDLHLSAGLGFHTLFNNMVQYAPVGLPTANAGIKLVYSKDHVYYGSGVELSRTYVQTRARSFQDEMNYTDVDGEDFTMRYSFNHFRQRFSSTYLNIPLLVGYEQSGYYGQAALSYSLHLNSSYTSIIDPLETKAYYPDFIEDMVNLPHHYLINKRMTYTGSTSFRSQVMLQMEAGMDISHLLPYAPTGKYIGRIFGQRMQEQIYNQLRIGVFCDLGLGNSYKPSDPFTEGTSPSSPFIKYHINPDQLKFNSLIGSQSHNTQLTSFAIGIKLTLVLRNRTFCDCNGKKIWARE